MLNGSHISLKTHEQLNVFYFPLIIIVVLNYYLHVNAKGFESNRITSFLCTLHDEMMFN
jgi:hypothetical protein